MAYEQKKKSRGPNFSANDKALLLNIVETYSSIIESKKTDAVWARQKEEAWRNIAADFCRCSAEGPRTAMQLKIAYENYKRRVKKAAADDKAELHKTGGGTFKRQLDEAGERLIARLNENLAPISNPCDSDGHYQVIGHSVGQGEDLIFDETIPVVDELEVDETIPVVDELEVGQASEEGMPMAQAEPLLLRSPETAEESTSMRRPAARQPAKRSRLEDYTSSKVDFNDLRCRLLLEKHSFEMQILQTNLEVAKTELEIKKAILAKELQK